MAPARASRAPGRAAKTVSAVVFGSDQGLVGQFNDVLADFVGKTLEALPGEKKVWAVGERIRARLADAGFVPMGLFAVPTSVMPSRRSSGRFSLQVKGITARARSFNFTSSQPPQVRGSL